MASMDTQVDVVFKYHRCDLIILFLLIIGTAIIVTMCTLNTQAELQEQKDLLRRLIARDCPSVDLTIQRLLNGDFDMLPGGK